MNRSKLQGDVVAAVIVGANKHEQLRVVGCWSSGSEWGRTDFNSGPVQDSAGSRSAAALRSKRSPIRDCTRFVSDSKREDGLRYLFLLG